MLFFASFVQMMPQPHDLREIEVIQLQLLNVPREVNATINVATFPNAAVTRCLKHAKNLLKVALAELEIKNIRLFYLFYQ